MHPSASSGPSLSSAAKSGRSAEDAARPAASAAGRSRAAPPLSPKRVIAVISLALQGEHEDAADAGDAGLGVAARSSAKAGWPLARVGDQPHPAGRSRQSASGAEELARSRAGPGTRAAPAACASRRPRVSSATTRVDVAALEGVGEAGRAARARPRDSGSGAADRALRRRLERRARPLQGAVHRGLAGVEHLRDLGGAVAEHVAQHQHGPLLRRHPLQAGDEGEADRLLRLVAGVGPGGAVGQALEQRVGVGLQPDRLGPARRLRGVGGRVSAEHGSRPAGRCRGAR